ncbi:unnamed protein product [Brassica napus]|uniref:(rape) hypothetical protein n=1 Tax=Brassica napus TaxID=3708 RepID=A0A816IC89_BRANA|nr:unnamed protein product [Brassica napus]
MPVGGKQGFEDTPGQYPSKSIITVSSKWGCSPNILSVLTMNKQVINRFGSVYSLGQHQYVGLRVLYPPAVLFLTLSTPAS